MEKTYDNNDQKYFLSVKELAAILPVSQTLIYERIARKKIPCLRIGRRILIPASYVQEILNVI